MTTKELYNVIGGDYDDIISRFGNDNMIERFLKKFIDEKSFNEFKDAFQKNDYEKSFLTCHTLKGICLNLAFRDLAKPVCELTEELRGNKKPNHPELFDKIEDKYNALISELIKYFKDKE